MRLLYGIWEWLQTVYNRDDQSPDCVPDPDRMASESEPSPHAKLGMKWSDAVKCMFTAFKMRFNSYEWIVQTGANFKFDRFKGCY